MNPNYFPLQGLLAVKFGYCRKPREEASIFILKWEEGVSEEDKRNTKKSLGLHLGAILFFANTLRSGKKNL